MNIEINYDYRQDAVQGIDVENLAKLVLKAEERPDKTEVSITFVDNETIAQLNEEYRGKEGPTDVLSFECDTVEGEEEFAEEVVDATGVVLLGDIVIAVDIAAKQSAEFGTTFEQEIELLVTHGLLHLCGYDHMVEEEAQVMEAREDELLAAWRAR